MERGRESWGIPNQTGLTLHILPEELSLTFQQRNLTPSCHSSSNVQIILCRSFSLSVPLSLSSPLTQYLKMFRFILFLSLILLLRKHAIHHISAKLRQRSRFDFQPFVYLPFIHTCITEQIIWSFRSLIRNVWVYSEIFNFVLGYRKSDCNLRSSSSWRLQHKSPLTLHCFPEEMSFFFRTFLEYFLQKETFLCVWKSGSTSMWIRTDLSPKPKIRKRVKFNIRMKKCKSTQLSERPYCCSSVDWPTRVQPTHTSPPHTHTHSSVPSLSFLWYHYYCCLSLDQ